jgi:hypothetical protein
VKAVGLLLLLSAAALADEPLEAPKTQVFWAPNGQYCAVSDPDPALTTVYRLDSKGPSKALWTVKTWFRQAELTDDGEALVAGPDSLNLLDEDYRPSDALLRFYVKGKRVRVLTVGEVFPRGKGLEKTVSHYSWGDVEGQEPGAVLRVSLLRSSAPLRYAMKTGKPVAGAAQALALPQRHPTACGSPGMP